MSDTETNTETNGEAADDAKSAELPGDARREQIVADLRHDIGDDLVDHHLLPTLDLWVRVTPAAWAKTAAALKQRGFDFFVFLSAIDWQPSPWGKNEDDPFAPASEQEEPDEPAEMTSGYAGGETRFQVFARFSDLDRHVGVTVKVDVPESLELPTIISSFAGANWHERETHEMFGIGFAGHPDLRNIYLPTDFEGYPLRKDFPLLARHIKPWPGIVDVEPLPDEGQPS